MMQRVHTISKEPISSLHINLYYRPHRSPKSQLKLTSLLSARAWAWVWEAGVTDVVIGQTKAVKLGCCPLVLYLWELLD